MQQQDLLVLGARILHRVIIINRQITNALSVARERSEAGPSKKTCPPPPDDAIIHKLTWLLSEYIFYSSISLARCWVTHVQEMS